MKVRDVLHNKDDSLIVGHAGMSVFDVAKTLANARVGVMMIVDAERYLLGTLSEPDIIRGLAIRGHRYLDLAAGSVMNHHPLTCEYDDDLRQVEITITRERTRHLPVVDIGGRVVGIVSIGDVLKHRLDTTQLELNVLRDFYLTRH